ncbi:MAG TPA: TetR/AcrR family transcriptional regulator [Myxococcota bacterium]|nr:TetR/AcrR family transcriptional regulator [Myxococcota bacterium]
MARIPAHRRDAHGEARRSQILEAALRVWLRDGFHAAPVEAIAREAGLGKGTIYLYFPTKEAILQGAVERFSLLPAIEALVGKLPEVPPEQAIPMLVAALWERLRERGTILALVLGGGALRPENARLFQERVLLPGNQLLAAYLDECVHRGALRPMDTFVASRALIGSLVMFMLSQNVLGGAALRPIPDAAIVETVSDLFLRGALPSA